MLGGGTSLDTIPNNTTLICLDLTRLLSRTGKVHTGVDRVEWAYLEWCLGLDRPVFGLVRTAFGYLLLDRAGIVYFHSKLRDAEWGRPDGLSRLAFRLSVTRRCAETALRKCAIARAAPPLLKRMVRKHFPSGVLYLNTGHSNLTRRVFSALKAVQHSQLVVLIHDMIPLDWPEHQRSGTVEKFEKRMRVVSEFSDALICNSQQTLDDTERHFLTFGRMPHAVVAHLGVEMPELTNATLPDIPMPYVVTVGTIEPRKNHAFLLDLWEDWHKDDASQPPHLVVCGNRGWKNEEVFARLENAKAKGLAITELNGLSDADLMGQHRRRQLRVRLIHRQHLRDTQHDHDNHWAR